MTRALAVIDGEHYAPVVREALASLPYAFVGALLVGGTEKLRGGDEYGVAVVDDLEQALADFTPEVAVDLSDEPVLAPRERFLLASRLLAAGIPYVGADFRFDPPTFAPFDVPSLAVIGTGKRVGKTAIAGHLARLFARDHEVVVVSMGRGGPADPEVVETPPSLDELVALSRAGHHAASDCYETAALAGVVTIGCRRAGGGLAGAPFFSNVLEAAELAASRRPDVVVFDGSGAAIPPVEVSGRILVAHEVEAGLNPYRVLISDLVVLTRGADNARAAVSELTDVPILTAELRLRAAEPLEGRRVAVFTAGAASTDYLDGEVVAVSRNLGDRAALRQDLAGVDADVYLVELKAAAIDVVAETALERGATVVFADNEVVAPGLDDAVAELVQVGVAK